jgi:YVTN family beta-propeller protein
VTVTVVNVDDDPVALDDTYVTIKNTALTVDSSPALTARSPTGLAASSSIGSGGGVLGNDTDADGKFLYITALSGTSVSVIDIATKNVIANIPVGNTPLGIAVSPDGTDIYVANENSNSVTVIAVT